MATSHELNSDVRHFIGMSQLGQANYVWARDCFGDLFTRSPHYHLCRVGGAALDELDGILRCLRGTSSRLSSMPHGRGGKTVLRPGHRIRSAGVTKA